MPITANTQWMIGFALAHLPDLSEPCKTTGKIIHRAWFSPKEYKTLYEATRRRAQNPKKERFRWECEQLHDYVLIMANTGLRPDEGRRLEFRDVKVVKVEGTNERILEIEVRGKRGVRDGQRRTAYSLRHTYVCFRLMEGADIYQIAKNCRTSVEMIEKYYASHIKT